MPVSLPHPSHAFPTLAPGSDADSNAASFPIFGVSFRLRVVLAGNYSRLFAYSFSSGVNG